MHPRPIELPRPVLLSKRMSVALAVAGTLLVVLGAWALFAIPRGPQEFLYIAWPRLEPLPFASMSGFTPWQLSSLLARLVFLGPGLLLLGLAVAPALRTFRIPRARPWVVLALAGVAILLVAAFVTRGVPFQDDGATYLMQAAPLSHGHLFAPPVPKTGRWAEPFTVFTSRGTTGKYLFGEPSVLALGLRAGVPLAGQILLALLTLLLVLAHARKAASPEVALGAVVLLAVSPCFLFTSATFLSEVPALAGVALAVYGLEVRGLRGGLWIGLGLGFALVCRPQVAAPCGLALLFSGRWDRRMLLGAVLGIAAPVASIFAYDRALSGNAWTLPWALAGVERLGFGHVLGNAYRYTPLQGLKEIGVVLTRLNGWALGWPISWLGPLAWIALRCPRWKLVRPWALVALATLGFQFFYYTVGTSDTGPIYHYAMLPFFAVSTVAALEVLLAGRWRASTLGVLAALVLLGTGSFVLEQSGRLRRLSDAIAARIHLKGMKTPALLFLDDEVWEPLPGWVFGPPSRERSPDAPVVYYPYTSPASSAYVEKLWPKRHCYFVRWAAESARWALESCPDTTSPWDVMPASWKAKGFGPNADWRKAFPWLP